MTVFETLAQIQPRIPGWCTKDKAEALAAMVIALRPQVSLEIGVWGGSSFIPLALAHKHIGYGTAIGIDPWTASESIRNEAPEHVAHWSRFNHDAVYQGFMNLITRLELGKFVQIIRKPSDQAQPPGSIDILHIDGNHQQQAVRDVMRYAPHVRKGGICVMDDLEWVRGNVKSAEKMLLGLGFRHLYHIGTGASYQRV